MLAFTRINVSLAHFSNVAHLSSWVWDRPLHELGCPQAGPGQKILLNEIGRAINFRPAQARFIEMSKLTMQIHLFIHSDA